MKFNNIDKDINAEQIEFAHKRLAWLFTELACSKTNEHIGTGCGGNEMQLFVLKNFNHSLAKNDNSIQLDNDTIIWGADWFVNSDKKAIRAKLDEAFPAIKENHKGNATDAALNDLLNGNIRENITKHKELFPKLIANINGEIFNRDETMSELETTLYACVLCQDLIDMLNKDDKSLIKPVGEILATLSPETVLYAVRKYIGLPGLVKYMLDEDKSFGPVLEAVNSTL